MNLISDRRFSIRVCAGVTSVNKSFFEIEMLSSNVASEEFVRRILKALSKEKPLEFF